MKGLVLYAAFLEGDRLPPYVRYALKTISAQKFPVVLITTASDLWPEDMDFLNQHRITLFSTINRGFDFGMWGRYLHTLPDQTRDELDRLVLINDSVVYFRNVLPGFIDSAERQDADVIGLSSNNDYGYHLQSYFLYIKKAALPFVLDRITVNDVALDYWDTVITQEVGLSYALKENGFALAHLCSTKGPFDFSYEEFIRSGGGFIKRKLLEKRFSFGQALHFLQRARHAYGLDYRNMILEHGSMDPSFSPAWLQTRSPVTRRQQLKKWLPVAVHRAWTFISDATIIASALLAGWLIAGEVVSLRMALTTITSATLLYIARDKLRTVIHARAVSPRLQSTRPEGKTRC